MERGVVMQGGEEGYCVVMCTCPGDEDAERIAGSLIKNRLAACVQIMPIRSFYEWEGKVHRDEERLLFIKTRDTLYQQLEDFISKNHPYKVPEIVQIPMRTALNKYLDWIDSVTG
jgi:periplasmic divalent cation tolerance protein